MKKIFATITAVILTVCVFSQAPEKMTYQAVVRNANGELIRNGPVGIKVSILKPIIINKGNQVIYAETHTTLTDDNGLMTLEIGTGDVETGTISQINWGYGPYYLMTEIDPEGGTNYTIVGESNILSVPYALYAKTAETSETSTDAVKITGDQTIEGNKTFSSTIIGNINGNAVSVTNGVYTTGNQTIAGNKTFTGTTTVPTPVNTNDAATKAYVDAIISQLSAKGAIVADADGNIYSTVRIGSQVWMAENLKTIKYKNGTDIPLVTDNTAWSNLITPGYCWYNNDAATYKATYGALYNWNTVNTGNLCPAGWHFPTDAEWTTLENYLIANGYNYDGTTSGNRYAKALGSTNLWTSSTNAGAVGNTDYPGKRNAIGFTALPGGCRAEDGTFAGIGDYCGWWSATESVANYAWSRYLSNGNIVVSKGNYNKKYGFSVRCVRD